MGNDSCHALFHSLWIAVCSGMMSLCDDRHLAADVQASPANGQSRELPLRSRFPTLREVDRDFVVSAETEY